MIRKFALLGLMVAGCRNDPTFSKDMAMGNADLTGIIQDQAGQVQDMPVGGDDMIVTTPATINDIDTGKIPGKTMVVVTGAVLTGVATYLSKDNKMNCNYQAFVQDSSAAPSGIKLFATGGMCTPMGMSCFCPFPPSSGTKLDDLLTLGDEFTIVGSVASIAFNLPDAGGGGLGDPQHEINVNFKGSSLTKTGAGKMVTPTVIADGTMFAPYAKGYTAYEDMLVTIKPANPGMTSSMYDNFGGWIYSSSHYVDTYKFFYNKGVDGGGLPGTSTTWTSITGVAIPDFGGGLAPRLGTDFVP